MKASKNGFTIVETMIFLAISGVTFIMAVTVMGNQQRTTQFNQSVYDFESRLNDIANDTATGAFPTINDVECRVSGADVIMFYDEVNSKPGDNNACIFVGNVVQLFDGDVPGRDSNYFLHTLVGVNDSSVNNFVGTKPKALYSDGTGGPGVANFGDAGTTNYSIPWETQIKRAYYKDGAANVYVRGITYAYSNFGSRISDETFTSGAATVALYVVVERNTPENENLATLTKADFRNSIDLNTGGSSSEFRIINDKIIICLEGVGGKQAMIEVGGDAGSVAARANFNISSECAAA